MAPARDRECDAVAARVDRGVDAGEEGVGARSANGAVERREDALGWVAVPGAVADGVACEPRERGGGGTGSADVAQHDGELARLLEGEDVVEVAADFVGFSVWPVPHRGIQPGHVGQGGGEQAALQRACDLALAFVEAQVLEA